MTIHSVVCTYMGPEKRTEKERAAESINAFGKGQGCLCTYWGHFLGL